MDTEALKGLLQSIFVLWFPGFYTLIAIYVALALNSIVNGGVTLVLMVSPCVAVWYIVVSKRERNTTKALLSPSGVRDNTEALKEYIEHTRKQQQKNVKS